MREWRERWAVRLVGVWIIAVLVAVVARSFGWLSEDDSLYVGFALVVALGVLMP